MYQWQSSPTGQNIWSNISAPSGSSSLAIGSQASSTDYQCRIYVMFPALMYLTSSIVTVKNAFCAPHVFNCSYANTNINSFILMGEVSTQIYDLATGCATNGYDNRTSESVSLLANTSYGGQLSSQYNSSEQFAIWIDFNDNSVFESSEQVAFGSLNGTNLTPFVMSIPAIGSVAKTGVHRMRASVARNSTPNACGTSSSYGETHDYTVNILTYTPSIPTPPCAAVSVGTNSSLYRASSGPTIYTCKTYSWTSPRTGTVTLAFQLRNDPDYWYVDDISVYNKGVQMLVNGGFESGPASPGWTLSTPYGTCSTPGKINTVSPRTGLYSLQDGSSSCTADQISQSFAVIAGQTYVVSFYIKTGLTGSVISISVTLS
ncbi:unnamed protein product [Adineta steineri]|uniref:GEVED domain-containing protein n=1 Tax=Adineta steineri TaxID=433720 RepID=A0A819VDN0_9BILA|nr:unnamed protein product [Adineta steineri]